MLFSVLETAETCYRRNGLPAAKERILLDVLAYRIFSWVSGGIAFARRSAKQQPIANVAHIYTVS